ncbi:Lipid IV(A) 3-deoxy-D-manno-octulosonic acid transferase protein [Dioscorea alata]|uniref:Lipid IV(A) 3-deoxy-D-manno-octulosonic acid transferase protein n=1 Tax=Dioscorea alata TaxID=55571 RepID=A0ACB7WD64_DIOAL|nr:Lipid IV(A) 3-deoxy-D-manno-octulosonic acid transferase protein [Dioscorea alata]
MSKIISLNWQAKDGYAEGKRELADAVSLLLGDAEALKARQNAARRAFCLVSEGVIHSVWNLMDAHVLKKGCC